MDHSSRVGVLVWGPARLDPRESHVEAGQSVVHPGESCAQVGHERAPSREGGTRADCSREAPRRGPAGDRDDAPDVLRAVTPVAFLERACWTAATRWS